MECVRGCCAFDVPVPLRSVAQIQDQQVAVQFVIIGKSGVFTSGQYVPGGFSRKVIIMYLCNFT